MDSKTAAKGTGLISIRASIWLLLISAVAAFGLKSFLLGFELSSDYNSYVGAAQGLIDGETSNPYFFRLTKPLSIVVIAAGMAASKNPFLGIAIQAFAGYVVFAWLCFVLGKTFFRNLTGALGTAILLAFSYPALRYGIELSTDAVAWCFYLCGMILTFMYWEKPTSKNLLFFTSIVSIGILWKEYVLVNIAVFGIAIFLNRKTERATKTLHLSILFTCILAIVSITQYYIYARYGFTWLGWYQGAASDGYKQLQIPLIAKSIFALQIAGWILILGGLSKISKLSFEKRILLITSFLPTLLVFLWGWTSSRLYFVMNPVFALLAMHGLYQIRGVNLRKMIFLIIVFLNVAWLTASMSWTGYDFIRSLK